MSVFRLVMALAMAGGFLVSTPVLAECGGTTQCIGIGPTIAAAQVGHHGGGPDTFTMAFGDQAVGTPAPSQTIFVEAVTGPAGSQVMLAPTTITGGDAGNFQISGGSCSPSNGPINGGAGCTIQVAFLPGSAGAKTAVVHVNLAFAGCVGCITERFATVTGNGVLAAPVANPVTVDVSFQTPRVIDLSASVSGSATSFAIGTPPAHGTATLSGSMVTYTPAAGYTGPDSFTYTATGPGGTSNPATVTIRVVAPTAPVASARAVSTAFNTPVAIDLTSSVSGSFTSIAIVAPPQHGTATVNGSVVTYTPTSGFVGVDTFTYSATGAGGTSAAAPVTVTITATPPAASPASMTVQVNTPTTIDLAPFVSGTGVTTVAIGTRPAHGTVTTSGLRATYTPALDYFGPDSFTYSAVGAAGTSPPAAVTIVVVGRPDPTRNPIVTGLLTAQAAASERFSQAQVSNFQGRMESLHRREVAAPAPRTAQASFDRRAQNEAQGDVAKPSFLQSSYASAVQLPFASEVASLVTNGSVAIDGLAPRGTNFWASGSARFGIRGADGAMQGLEFTTSGLSVGADRRFSDQLAAGVGIGYGRDRTDIGTEGSRSRATSVSIAAYSSYQPSPQSFIDAVLGYGWLDFSSRRFVAAVNDFAESSRDGGQFFASIAAGYEHRANGVLISPYARLDHSSAKLDATSETGAGIFALTYGSQKNPFTQGALGVRAETIHEADFGWINPRARAELRHSFQGAGSATIAYVDVPGTTYALSPPSSERNSFALGLGTEFITRGGMTAGIEYQMRRASSRDNDQGIRLYISQDLDGRGNASWLPNFRMEPTPSRDIQVDAGFMHDDNVSRAQLDADHLADQSFSANARYSHTFPLTPNTRFVANGVLGGEKFKRYDGLSRATLGFEGELQYRASGDFLAPTLALFFNANADGYQSSLRDGARYAAGASIRGALTDRVTGFAAYTHTRRTAEGEVWEGRDNSVRANLDYQWSRKGTFYLGAEYRKGDAVGSGKEPGPGNFFPHTHDYQHEALDSDDDAFPGYGAYRFKGKTTIGTVGFNYSIAPRQSLDLSWRHVQTKPDGTWGVETLYGTVLIDRYKTNQYFIVYLLSF